MRLKSTIHNNPRLAVWETLYHAGMHSIIEAEVDIVHDTVSNSTDVLSVWVTELRPYSSVEAVPQGLLTLSRPPVHHTEYHRLLVHYRYIQRLQVNDSVVSSAQRREWEGGICLFGVGIKHVQYFIVFDGAGDILGVCGEDRGGGCMV